MARARPARLRIPPEISPGSFFSAPCRPTIIIFSMTMSAISFSDFLVCSRSGKAMLSNRFIEPNSAPSWNSTPNSLRVSYRLPLGAVRDVDVADEDRALVGLEQADQRLEEHRLAGAGRAEQRGDLAVRQRQGDVTPDALLAERLRQIGDHNLDAHAKFLPVRTRLTRTTGGWGPSLQRRHVRLVTPSSESFAGISPGCRSASLPSAVRRPSKGRTSRLLRGGLMGGKAADPGSGCGGPAEDADGAVPLARNRPIGVVQ